MKVSSARQRGQLLRTDDLVFDLDDIPADILAVSEESFQDPGLRYKTRDNTGSTCIGNNYNRITAANIATQVMTGMMVKDVEIGENKLCTISNVRNDDSKRNTINNVSTHGNMACIANDIITNDMMDGTTKDKGNHDILVNIANDIAEDVGIDDTVDRVRVCGNMRRLINNDKQGGEMGKPRPAYRNSVSQNETLSCKETAIEKPLRCIRNMNSDCDKLDSLKSISHRKDLIVSCDSTTEEKSVVSAENKQVDLKILGRSHSECSDFLQVLSQDEQMRRRSLQTSDSSFCLVSSRAGKENRIKFMHQPKVDELETIAAESSCNKETTDERLDEFESVQFQHGTQKQRGLVRNSSVKEDLSFTAVVNEIKQTDLPEIGLNIGIDFTMSNLTRGQRTFGGRSLHDVTSSKMNPYKEVICLLGVTMEELKPKDGEIRVFGFGRTLFPINNQKDPCKDFMDVLESYQETVNCLRMGGTSDFAPLIHEAIKCYQRMKCFQLLLILTNGQLTKVEETLKALNEASAYPVSICTIGVGDGPWEVMERLGDEEHRKNFDNYCFINFQRHKEEYGSVETDVAVDILRKLPEQMRANSHLLNLK